jgi:hypothetical protein
LSEQRLHLLHRLSIEHHFRFELRELLGRQGLLKRFGPARGEFTLESARQE